MLIIRMVRRRLGRVLVFVVAFPGVCFVLRRVTFDTG